MISWNISNNVIDSINFRGANLINPWGFETADSLAFFSLETGYGYRYKLLKEKNYIDHGIFRGYREVQMPEGKWELNFCDKIIGARKVERIVELNCLSDSILMDFVLRYRVKKEFVDHALINGIKILHTNSNIYHQYAVNEVTLVGLDDLNYHFKIDEMKLAGGMTANMYVRDRGDEWIVHVRMMPTLYEKKVIKLCNSWAQTRPIPDWMTQILLKNNKIQNALWYRGESKPYTNRIMRIINPVAFGMAKLREGEMLKWKVIFEILPKLHND